MEWLDARLRERIDQKSLAATVQAKFFPLTDPSLLCLVAETATGEFAGHALYEVGVPHPQIGIDEARLVDIYTLAPFRGRGLAHCLAAVGIHECAARGLPFLSGTVEATPSREAACAFVAQLVSQDWWPALTIAGRPV